MIDFTKTTVGISRYWPDFYKDYPDLLAVAQAKEAALREAQAAVQAAYTNNFVYAADETGLAHYERELGIIPTTDATLEDRRVEILARLNARMPYTKRVLKRFLDNLVGADGYAMTIDAAAYTVILKIELKRKNQVASVASLLRKVLPANMSYAVQIRWNQVYMLSKLTFKELAAYKVSDLKENPEIKEIFINRGGVLI